MEEAVGRFSVSCKFTNVSDQFVWAFTGVYGPNLHQDRRFPSECLGSTSFTAAMWEFSNFISEQGLIDLPLQGGTFTWSNSREVVSKARLDKFLFSADWEDKFPTISQRRMFRLYSDHFPIVLKGGSFQRRSMLFRLENMWLKDDGFVDMVRWNEEVFGHVEVRTKKLWKDLSVLENMEESRGLLVEERVEMGRIRDELEKVTLLEEIC
ncbi:uncharacterized protein LOC112003378 [Quercus suber]|uniref:uncharacterized protein LOC112003378 n=1 Tax=Quercus suber TaxID=58331 RepID=UPI000CE2480D|nr:uncharacterized protein LOC112003378 [Quercus suber]